MLNATSPKKMQQCVIYSRVSSLKQTNDGDNFASQERSCRDYAANAGYEVLDVFTDVVSGKERVRPGINKLLAFLQQSKKQSIVVVVDDITRFARDVATHTDLREKIVALNARLESPKQKFGDDAGSRFIETVFAAIAEHDRVKNAEQSHSRSIARMKNGYWVLPSPIGYCYEKGAGGGKVLVRKEPIATIVKEALEGFASGRFETQVEVQRFLERKPAFPKGPDGKSVKIDRVTNMLTQTLYTGYLRFEQWGAPLTEGNHEAIISYETLTRNQERLTDRKVAPA